MKNRELFLHVAQTMIVLLYVTSLLFFLELSFVKWHSAFQNCFTDSLNKGVTLDECFSYNNTHIPISVISVFTFSLSIIIFKLLQRFLLLDTKKKINKSKENFNLKVFNLIKDEFNFKKVKVGGTETKVVRSTLFLKPKDAFLLISGARETLFKIHHEMYHLKTHDVYIGYLSKIIMQLVIFLSIPVLIFILSNSIRITLSIDMENPLVILTFFIVFYFFIKKIINIIKKENYFNECLCDRYAHKKMKGVVDLDKLFPSGDKSTLIHPTNIGHL